jgi:surface protein
MTYKCDVANAGLTLPWKNIKGTITWSDGTVQNYATATASSTPKALNAGTVYMVTLDGTFTDFYYSPVVADQQCIRSLDHWGANAGTVTAFRAFQSASNLVSVPDHVPSTLTNFREMFVQATSLNDPNISKWDTSNVTNMSAMFFGATAFNQPLNDWNVSNVTTMTKMFSGASNFNQPLDKWNTGKVTSLTEMFSSAPKFNQSLNSWDVTKVQTMDGLFFRASNYDQPMNNWKTLALTNMQNTFAEATKFNQPLDKWDTSKVTTMTGTFWTANAFNQNISGWNVATVASHTNFANAAFNATYLPSFPTP